MSMHGAGRSEAPDLEASSLGRRRRSPGAAKMARLAAVAPLLAATAVPAAAAPLAVNAGDTAWLIVATAFVLLMAVPGLALFYAGLVRAKNVVSVLTQVISVVCVTALIWILYAYSLAYTGGTWASFFGGLWKAGLHGVTPDSVAPTRVNGAGVPELAFVAFQMTFACVTPALIVGAFAERMRFSAVLMFAALWVTIVYAPIAHMAWYGPSADAIADAARAVEHAVTAEARAKAKAALALVQSDAGLFAQWGALDFAGGSVVHINAGIAGLVGAVTVGPRLGYGRQSMTPHNLAMMLTGGALLWVGWMGFNAGSSLRADGIAALAMMNTFAAAAAGAVAWAAIELRMRGKPSSLGLATGLLAGLVAVTPASGYIAPLAALLLGLVAGAVCFWACTALKQRYGYDDALDVFGVHCVAGLLGMLATGVLVNPALGGTGVLDFAAKPGSGVVQPYDAAAQIWAQAKACIVTLAWSGYASARLYTLVDMAVGLRPSEKEEEVGLDVSDHGERAYGS